MDMVSTGINRMGWVKGGVMQPRQCDSLGALAVMGLV